MYSFSITHAKFNIIRQLLNHRGFELMNIYTSAIATKISLNRITSFHNQMVHDFRAYMYVSS